MDWASLVLPTFPVASDCEDVVKTRCVGPTQLDACRRHDAEEGGPGTLHRQHSAVLRMLPSFEQGMDVDEDDGTGRRWTKEEDEKLRDAVAKGGTHVNRDADSISEGLLLDGGRCRV